MHSLSRKPFRSLMAVGLGLLVAAMWEPSGGPAASPPPVLTAAAGMCGDADGSTIVNSSDVQVTLDYCFGGDAPPDSLQLADCDDYDSVTIRDVCKLSDFAFFAGPAPICPPSQPSYVPTLATTDTLFVPTDILPAGDSVISPGLLYNGSSSIVGLGLPLRVTVGGAVPTFDSVRFGAAIMGMSPFRAYSVDSAAGTVNIGVAPILSTWPLGLDLLVALDLYIAPMPYPRPVQIDTLRLAPHNSPMFVEDDLDGVVPNIFGLQVNGAELCGDVNGSFSVTVADFVGIHNYCFANEAPGDYMWQGDMDGYAGINIADEMYLVDYIFKGGSAPICPVTQPELIPALKPADTIWIPADTLAAFATSIDVPITYKNTEATYALVLPLKVAIGGTIPTVDSVRFEGASASEWSFRTATVDSARGEILIAGASLATGLSPTTATILLLQLSVPAAPSPRAVQIDTVRLAPSNYPMAIDLDRDAVLPVITGLQPAGPAAVPHDLEFTLYSPVYMVVTDPLGDSIGLDFNTIQDGSTYDTTRDVNTDLELDDVVTVPNPVEGDYNVRIVRADGVPDSAKFTLSIRINGNQLLIPDGYNAATVDQLGTTIPDTYGYVAAATLKGDANADGSTTSADIIYLVNFVFKSGPDTVVPGHGDVNCSGVVTSADIIYLVNYVFKSGMPPCS